MQAELPIYELRHALRDVWLRDQPKHLVLIAPTGSGKTTQVCQMLYADLAAPLGDKRIVVLQPRRVAARSVARRVAEEMGSELGKRVGYQVRFDERLSAETRIAFVTEGVLLRWLQSDPLLSNVGAVLFDEFHERNLLSDMALALCKRLQQTARPDLWLIVMSATLEAQPVAAYLSSANPRRSETGHNADIAQFAQDEGTPVLESQGRSYPVEINYQSWDDDSAVWERAAKQTADILRTTPAGDVLVFMPGMYEIQRTLEELRRARVLCADGNPPALLALHGEMNLREQDRVFAASSYRRVIVATNVAETSLTIPGIRFVVDAGQARVARYDPARGVNTLHVEPISQASADQRAGRAGRMAPGVCFRLWSQKNHAARPIKNTPEVQRTELSSVVLQLIGLGVSDVAQFDFLDKPSPARIRAAEALLESLGAIAPLPFQGSDEATTALRGAGFAITDIGQQMLRIPVHPRYARMLVEAQQYNCVREVALMAALVSGRDLLTRLSRDDGSAVQLRNRQSLIKKGQSVSDFFLLANAFEHAVQHDFAPQPCYNFGINPHVAREVAQTYEQLLDVCGEAGLLVRQETEGLEDQAAEVTEETMRQGQPVSSSFPHPLIAASFEDICRCHLVGFVDHLAVRTSTGSDEFDLSGGRRCTLMDESIVGRNMLIVASVIREITARRDGRDGEKLTLLGFGSAVQVEWVRALNPPGLTEQVEYVYDRLHKRVVAGRVLRWHDLLLGGAPVQALDLDKAALVLADEYAHQLNKLPQWGQLKPMLAAKPNLTRDAIVRALAQAWHGATTLEDALKRDVVTAFRAML